MPDSRGTGALDRESPRAVTGAATEETLAATALTGHARSGDDSLGDEPVLTEGTAIGRYLVVERLGAGGMGVVYVAYDPQLDRRVALKLLRRNTAKDSSARDRLLREAQALARLSHPSVVAIHDVGEHDGRVFLAMELVEGQTLRKWLRASTHSIREIVAVLCRAGEGLAAAHDKGIVHRDFKPDNVMVGEDGRVRVMDFGIARADESTSASASVSGPIGELRKAEPVDPTLTRDGATLGTPAYMAPEQHLHRNTDARTDQFSFCVTAYEALFQARPFSGDSIAALSWSVTEGQLGPTPRGHRVPHRVQRAIIRGLATQPTERWPTMAELLAELSYDPGPKRLRWLAAGAVLATVAAGVGWQQWSRARSVQACEREGQALNTVWNDARKASIGQALHATEVAYADDTWARASKTLDKYTAQWAEHRTNACLHATVEHTWPMPLLRSATECLGERRARLTTLLDRFEQPEQSTVARVVSAVTYLAPLSECTDPSWLAQRPTVDSDDPERAQAIATIRERLAEVGALSTTGRYAEAAQQSQQIVDDATLLDSLPILAEATVTLGLALERHGKFERAREQLEHAFLVAGAAGHDAIALKAATRLTFVIGYQLADYEQGLHWADLAQMLVTRMGLDDDAAVSRLRSNVGSVHQAKGRYDEAQRAQQQALDIARAVFGEDHPRVAVTWTNLANAQLGRGKYEEAIEAHTRALTIYEASLGEFHPDLAMTLLNLGVAQHKRDDDPAAIVSFERALKIQTTAFGEEHPQVARTLNNLGSMHFSSGDETAALASFERALAIQRKTLGEHHHDLAGSYNNIGRVHLQRDDPRAALASYQQALDIRTDTLGPTHPHVARVHQSMGRAHRAIGDFDQAIAAHEHALSIWETAHGPDHPTVANALTGLGEALIDAGDSVRATAVLRRALEIRTATQARPTALSETRFALARALLDGPDRPRALPLAEQARTELQAAGLPTEALDTWLAEHSGREALP